MNAVDALFEIGSTASVHVETIATGMSLLVIEDFYNNPMAVREAALVGKYDSSLAYYPGMHAGIDHPGLQKLFSQLSYLISTLGRVGCDASDFLSDFSIVTTPASQMLAKQKHPHIDPTPLAGVLYLNNSFEIGTCFFRHKLLDLAIVKTDTEREGYYKWMAEHGEATQPSTYEVTDNTIWEHAHSVPGKFNRLVIYPGNAFHSIDMRDVSNSRSMTAARLTQRFFVSKIHSDVEHMKATN